MARNRRRRPLARSCIVKIGRRYADSLELLAITPGTELARGVARTLNLIARTDDLPVAGLDERALLPPTNWMFRRLVTGTILWLYYDADATFVRAIAVVRVVLRLS